MSEDGQDCSWDSKCCGGGGGGGAAGEFTKGGGGGVQWQFCSKGGGGPPTRGKSSSRRGGGGGPDPLDLPLGWTCTNLQRSLLPQREDAVNSTVLFLQATKTAISQYCGVSFPFCSWFVEVWGKELYETSSVPDNPKMLNRGFIFSLKADMTQLKA